MSMEPAKELSADRRPIDNRQTPDSEFSRPGGKFHHDVAQTWMPGDGRIFGSGLHP
jgi:hypothetical protein